MKKMAFAAVLTAFSIMSCTGQKHTEKTTDNTDSIQPETNFSVHKEYDEHGNLISVDSTYTYFYSNIKNDSLREQEIFNNFKMNLGDHFQSMDSLFMNELYNNQMPFNMNDFYTDDFFQKNFDLKRENIQNIFKQMDSLKNSFYNEQEKAIKQSSGHKM